MADLLPLNLVNDPRLTETVEVPAEYVAQLMGMPAPLTSEPTTITRRVQVHLGLGWQGTSLSLSVCRWCRGPLFDRAEHLAAHTAWHQANGLHAADCTGPLRHPDNQMHPCPCGLIP